MTLSWLLSTGLTNAALATLLALVALGISRLVRSPALTHLLWVVVLLKLFAPPLIQVPIGLKLTILPNYEASAAEPAELTDKVRIQPSKPAVVAPFANSSAPSSALTSDVRGATVPRTLDSSSSRDLPIGRARATWTWLAAALNSSARIAIAWLPAIWLGGAAAMLVLAVYRSWRFVRFLRIEGQADAALASRLAMLAR